MIEFKSPISLFEVPNNLDAAKCLEPQVFFDFDEKAADGWYIAYLCFIVAYHLLYVSAMVHQIMIVRNKDARFAEYR